MKGFCIRGNAHDFADLLDLVMALNGKETRIADVTAPEFVKLCEFAKVAGKKIEPSLVR